VTAALIDQIMCRHCGTSLVADVTGHAWEAVVTYRRCPCLPDNPGDLAADVARRHRDATEPARRRAHLARWVAEQERRADR